MSEAALQSYLEADKLFAGQSRNSLPSRAAILQPHCQNHEQGRDAKTLAVRIALDCATRALKAGPQNPRSHVCMAVCLAKNFPYSDNQTKVNYSRRIKSEAEQAIALDPKYDLFLSYARPLEL